MSCEIGVMGLAVMGQNLALNIASKGFKTAVWNRTDSKVDTCVQRAKEEGNLPLEGFYKLEDFVQALQKPRKMIIMIQAGKPVDLALESLLPLLEKEDLVIDGGNEWYENTTRRTHLCEDKGVRFMGMGVSGGEDGARFGPALMPGGTKEGWDCVKHILQKIAAQVDDGPCVSYIGPGGAGNYVKMVHNGIEYGDMQLICETYDMLKRVGGLSNEELAKAFSDWNNGELKSFLIEITADIFLRRDDEGDGFLVDMVLDKAGSKGTGMWTVQEAAANGVPCPTISAALDNRYMSAMKDARVAASKVFPPKKVEIVPDPKQFVEDVRNALYCAKICSYAQGLMLLQAASFKNNWGLNLGEISRCWKGGCIIRAVFLDRIKKGFDRNPDMHSLLMDEQFKAELKQREDSWRRVVISAQHNGVPVPALSASLAYYDAYRAERLPINLLQAQRDYFGAHTYQRINGDGSPVHTKWSSKV